MATVDIKNWDEKNTASVGTLSDGSSFTGLTKVQPIRVTWNNGSTSTGSGDSAFTVDITSEDELVVTQSDESTTRPYQIPYFDSTNEVAWIWVYGSWNSDGSDQVVVGCGTGDGTDYSWNGPHSSSGTGNNPWTQTGVNVDQVLHLIDGSYVDSSGNNYDGTATGSPSVVTDGVYGDAISFDGTDDGLDKTAVGTYGSSTTGAVTQMLWTKASNLSSSSVLEQAPTSGSQFLAIQQGNNSPSGAVELFYRDNDSDNLRIYTNNTYDDGTWTQIGTTKDSNNDAAGMQIYYDGSQQTKDLTQVQNTYDNVSDFTETALAFNTGGNTQYYPGDMTAYRLYVGDEKSANFMLAEYDASPNGGQSFFSWGGATSTGTNANAVVTSSTGTPLTSTTSSTANSNGKVTSSTGSPLQATSSSTTNSNAVATTGTGTPLTSSTSSTANSDAVATSATGSPIQAVTSSTTNSAATITGSTGTPLTATTSTPGTNANAVITQANATTLTANTNPSPIDANAVITQANGSTLQVQSVDLTVTANPASATGRPISAATTSIQDSGTKITQANATPLTAGTNSTSNADTGITSVSFTVLTADGKSTSNADATITVAKGTEQDAETAISFFPRTSTETVDIKKDQTETLNGDIYGND